MCDIKVTHNFFPEKTPQVIDAALEPLTGQYCCITSFKLATTTTTTAAEDTVEGRGESDVSISLMLCANDDHVLTKSYV